MSFTKKIVRNTLFNAVGRIWSLLGGLLVVPYVIGHLGTEVYGMWALVLVVGNSYAVLDFGIASSLTAFMSERLALGDTEGANGIASTGFFLLLGLSLTICALAYPIMPLLAVNVFHVGLEGVGETSSVLRLGLLIFLVSTILNFAQAILFGAQQMGAANLAIVGTSTLAFAGVFFVVKSGWGLMGLALNQVLWSTVSAIVTALIAFVKIPGLRIRVRAVSRASAWRIARYGSKLQVVTATGFLMEQVNKLLVGAFVGLTAVTYLDVALKIVSMVRLPTMFLLSAIVPSVSELHALRDTSRLATLYQRGMKYIAMASIPMATIVIVIVHPVVAFFLKSASRAVEVAVIVLTVSYTVNLFTGIGTTIARGIGNPVVEMRYSLISAALSVTLVPLLGSLYGFYGIVTVLSLATVGGSVYFFVRFGRLQRTYFESAEGSWRSNLFKLMVPSVVIVVVALVLRGAQDVFGAMAVFVSFGLCVLYLSLLVWTVLRFPMLDAGDRAVVNSVIGMIRKR